MDADAVVAAKIFDEVSTGTIAVIGSYSTEPSVSLFKYIYCLPCTDSFGNLKTQIKSVTTRPRTDCR